MAKIQRTPVQSKAAKSIGYDPATQTLEIEFGNGGVYTASGVPAEEHQKLLLAESIGGHFQKHLRNNYNFTRVDEQADE